MEENASKDMPKSRRLPLLRGRSYMLGRLFGGFDEFGIMSRVTAAAVHLLLA